jgi:serine/threonine protein kinase
MGDNAHSMAFSSIFSSKMVKGMINSHDTAEVPINELELESQPFAAGGGGQLFRGTYKKNFKIAAKTVLADMSLTDLEEFRQEYRILTKLRHPNIMRTFGTSLDPKSNTLYIVTEMCDGGSLERYIDKSCEIYTPAAVGVVLSKVFDAVSYMHNYVGLVHRGIITHIDLCVCLLNQRLMHFPYFPSPLFHDSHIAHQLLSTMNIYN